MKRIIQASIAAPRSIVPQCQLAWTSVPTRRRDAWVSAWLPLLLSMACLTAPVATEAATVWSGPKVVFTKAAAADPKQDVNQDRLTSNVWFTRGNSQGLYNIAREAVFTHSVSPADTEWASGTTANYASLTYTDWETWARSVGNPPATPGVNAVLHLKTDDIYLDIKFLSWSERSGGFSYERSTSGASSIPQTGVWWNANESGWGMSITQNAGRTFSAIYTYDQSGAPTWYTIPNCPISGNSCSGSIYTVKGGTNPALPWNGSGILVSPVGTGTLTFTDANNGTFNYSINGVAASKAISRGILATGDTPPAVDYTDLWWNASESGWGVAITHQFGKIFVAWYTYDASGNAIWYVASDCPVVASGCTGALYEVTAGSPVTSVWDGSHLAITPVGSVSFAFSDANNATMSYSINGLSSSRVITRATY